MLSDPRKKWSGFGMTLRLPNTPISDMWYSHLETPDGRWKPLWGADGTGTIYSGKVSTLRDADVFVVVFFFFNFVS